MLEKESKNYLLNFEDLIDPRRRKNKIYDDCFGILLEENIKPDDSNINLQIIDICITLDKNYEEATLLYREQNGTPYINDKTKEVKHKPIEYKRLDVSISESIRLANIYTDKYNQRQIGTRIQELQNFSKEPSFELFNQAMNELKVLYSFADKDIKYITHWMTNVKRIILNKNIELPQILCFTSNKQFVGKSLLASTIAKVLNKRIITTDLIKLSARFQPLTLTTEAVLWIDELGKLDKTISDKMKTLITSDTIDFEYKGKNGFKQLRKLASIIMSINYDPSSIFYEDESQRRIAIIQFNGFTKEKTKEEIETLITNIWNNSPIEYIISPKEIAELTFNETKENSILENFASKSVLEMFSNNEYLTKTKIMNNLYSYNGGQQKLLAFLKNDEYFLRKMKTNGMYLFKPTDTFILLLKELIEDTDDFFDNNIYEFEKAV